MASLLESIFADCCEDIWSLFWIRGKIVFDVSSFSPIIFSAAISGEAILSCTVSSDGLNILDWAKDMAFVGNIRPEITKITRKEIPVITGSELKPFLKFLNPPLGYTLQTTNLIFGDLTWLKNHTTRLHWYTLANKIYCKCILHLSNK